MKDLIWLAVLLGIFLTPWVFRVRHRKAAEAEFQKWYDAGPWRVEVSQGNIVATNGKESLSYIGAHGCSQAPYNHSQAEYTRAMQQSDVPAAKRWCAQTNRKLHIDNEKKAWLEAREGSTL